jgi:tetratricopeptide (TPR) repeat protein
MRHPALVAAALAATAPALVAQVDDPYATEGFVVELITTRHSFNADGTGTETRRTRVRIQSQFGVEAFGTLAFPYMAATHRLAINYVTVRKPDGRVVPVDTAAAQDRAPAVEAGAPVYTDTRERHLVVPSLRPGDVLEFEWALDTHRPLAPGAFWGSHVFAVEAVVLSESLIVDVPVLTQLSVNLTGHADGVVTESAGRRTFVWTHQSLDPPDPNALVPAPPEDGYPTVHFSTFTSWEAMASWADGLFADRVMADSAVRAVTEGLVADLSDQTSRVLAIYEYVSTQVRYVSISLGLGRYQPHAAAEVLANGYGDCKDKHTLLAAMLSVIGVRSYPVLLHSGLPLDTVVPAVSQFDHVMSVVEVDGEYVFLDTTAEVAPFGLVPINLRAKDVLLLGPEGPSIGVTPHAPGFDVVYTTEVDGDLGESGDIRAQIGYRWRGDGELLMRASFRATPPSYWPQLLSTMAEMEGFDGPVTEPAVADADALADPFEVRFRAAALSAVRWTERTGRLSVPLERLGVAETPLEGPDAPDSVPIGGPLRLEQSLRLRLPASVTASPPAGIALQRPYGGYESRYGVEDGVLVIERTVTYEPMWLHRASYQDYRAFLRAIRADGDQTVGLERTATAVAATDAVLAEEEIAALHQTGYEALEGDDFERAVAVLSRVVEADPEHPYAWNNLGRAHAGREEYAEAEAAYRRQIAVNPFDEFAHNNLGSVLGRLGRTEEAIASFRRQLEINPLDRYANGNLGRLLVEGRRYEEALPLLERAISIEPDNPGLRFTIAEALQSIGRGEEAVPHLQKGMSLAPPSNPEVMSDSALIAGIAEGSITVASEKRLPVGSIPPSVIISLIRAEQYSDARTMLERAMDERPADGRFHALMATVLLGERQFDSALVSIVALAQSDSVFLAHDFGLTPATDDFEAMYAAAVRLSSRQPDVAFVWAELARYAFYTNRMEEADAAYARAERINPGFFEFFRKHAELREIVHGITR